MEPAKPVRFRFGPFEVDLGSSELFKGGEKIQIQTKPLQFLANLLSRAGSEVTREEMSHALWPDIYVQVNQGMNAAARKLRIALDDHPTRPKYFETLGSKGYRFVHPVEVLRWSSEDPGQEPRSIRIAVVPASTTEQQDTVLLEGIAVQLIQQLGRVHRLLKVIGPDSTGKVFATGVDFGSVQRQFGLDYLVTVNLEKHSKSLRVTASLRRGEGLQLVWTETFDRKREEIFSIEQEIAAHVIRSLSAMSIPAKTSHVPQKTTFSAYERYLAGRYHFARRTPESLQLAREAFERAVETDPEYALAHAGLADTYNLLSSRGLMHPRQGFQKAKIAAERAIALKAELPEALVPLAWAQLSLDHDWAAATRNFEKALQICPSYAFAYHGYAYLLASRGQIDKAVASFYKALELEPLSVPLLVLTSAFCYFAHRYDESVQHARKALELDPGYKEAVGWLVLALAAQRRFAEAVAELSKEIDRWMEYPLVGAQFASVLADAGRSAQAEDILRQLENGLVSVRPSYHIGLVKLALGDVSGALKWIEVAIQERIHWTLMMAVDPRAEILRGTKKFEELCRAAREPDERLRANSN